MPAKTLTGNILETCTHFNIKLFASKKVRKLDLETKAVHLTSAPVLCSAGLIATFDKNILD